MPASVALRARDVGAIPFGSKLLKMETGVLDPLRVLEGHIKVA